MSDKITRLITQIAEIGKNHPSTPNLKKIEIFQHYFNANGELLPQTLDQRDGSLTKREILARFLLLNAVLDQGPDMTGVRELLTNLTNYLYRQEVRFLHTPYAFFKEIGIAIDQILREHDAIKKIRAEVWARINNSNPNKYNLFMDNAKQVLGYAIFRWGVPLALPLLLEKDSKDEESKAVAFTSYIDSYPSAEIMSQNLKDRERYGLGKAIGDKGAHLFAKWYTTSFRLTKKFKDPAWGPLSYEVPFDSNAGRVLWRTGFFLECAGEHEYIEKAAIQPKKGKGGTDYIRVTNFRGVSCSNQPLIKPIRESYNKICTRYILSHKKEPTKVEIQRIPLAILHRKGEVLTIANFDDGLMYIGTEFCVNTATPICNKCPLNSLCDGFQKKPKLIRNYRT